MYDRELAGTHILVPLDGSELAERALPVAARVASALTATLVLVRITPTVTIPPDEQDEAGSTALYQRIADEDAHAAAVYLEDVARPLREHGLRVQTITGRGVAAPALIDLLGPLQIGLVVLTTHGRTGMARAALGSIADTLVHGSDVPVLLLRPLLGEYANQQLDRAVVPLDGSPVAEAALGTAVALSGGLVHHLLLLRVVLPREGVTGEGAMQEARHYLAEVGAHLTQKLAGRATVETRVTSGDAAEQIIRCAEHSCDLIIMATHGATGTRRWVFGSVADRVLHETGTPLVLILPLSLYAGS